MNACPNCGASFISSRRSQTFCSPGCRTAFYDVQAIRGKVALPFLQTWRRGKRGTNEASTYAFAQLCALADKWNAEDAAAGRDAGLIVALKRATSWRAVDLA